MVRLAHPDYCRELPDGDRCSDYLMEPGNFTIRRRIEEEVPVPTVMEAMGLFLNAHILRRAGYQTVAPYHPDRQNPRRDPHPQEEA